jgi:hypothetical protein
MTEEQQGPSPVAIQATAAKAADSSWINWQQQEKQATLRRLEETAKYLSGLSSLSLTIMLGANKDALKLLSNSTSLKVGIVCWLASIVLTLAVVFPFRYNYVENSADSIRTMNNRISRAKFTLLVLGALLYIAGISLVAYLYLFCQTPPPAQ